jgi:hypothetical protein
MLSRRRIETGFDVDDPIGCFATDDMLLYLVQNKFEGRCFRGCFIQKVEKIVRMSECSIQRDSNAMRGSVCLEFEATVLTYPTGWVVVGCRVELVNEKSELIIARRDHIHACIKRVRMLESIQVGQIIPIMVSRVTYNINDTSVSVIGALFTPPLEPVIYQCVPSHTDPAIYTQILQEIATEEELAHTYMSTHKSSYETFRRLLSPYTNRPQIATSEQEVQIKSAIAAGPKYLSRDGRLDLLLPVCVGMDELPPDERVTARVVCLPRGEAIMRVLMDYYIYLRVCREMITWYSDVNVVNAHKNLWAIYGTRKIDKVAR